MTNKKGVSGWYGEKERHSQAALKAALRRYHNQGLVRFSPTNIEKALSRVGTGLVKNLAISSAANILLSTSGFPITPDNIQLAKEANDLLPALKGGVSLRYKSS